MEAPSLPQKIGPVFCELSKLGRELVLGPAEFCPTAEEPGAESNDGDDALFERRQTSFMVFLLKPWEKDPFNR